MISYDACLARLRDGCQSVPEDGGKTLIKSIPDADGNSRMDPRLFNDLRNSSGLSYPADFGSVTGEELRVLRSQMGAPNVDLSSGVTVSVAHIGTRRMPLYIYSPKRVSGGNAVLYIHGGGFLGGTALIDENPCKLLADRAQCVVVSPEYRLAPEYPFPCALDDSCDALDWLAANAGSLGVSCDRIFVSGDSAGGNLALSCVLRDAALGRRRIIGQLLLYPCLNPGKLIEAGSPWSAEKYMLGDDGGMLRRVVDDVGIFCDLISRTYVSRREDLLNELVSPLLRDSFAGLPRSMIVTAEFDYLRLEGEELARRLARDRVETRLIRYSGLGHAFVEHLGYYPQSEDCIDEMARFIGGAVL